METLKKIRMSIGLKKHGPPPKTFLILNINPGRIWNTPK